MELATVRCMAGRTTLLVTLPGGGNTTVHLLPGQTFTLAISDEPVDECRHPNCSCERPDDCR